MSNPLIQPVLNSFLNRTPLRVGSLIVTIFGDAVLPYGEYIRLTSLLGLTSAIGIDDGAVRVAIHRLEKEGWLKKQKVGRNALYALSKASETQSQIAGKLIYGFDNIQATSDLQMLIMAEGPGRAKVRDRLLQSGWGLIAANIVLASGSHEQLQALHELPQNDSHYVVQFNANNRDVQRLCAKAWSLETLNDAYKNFVQLYQPIADKINSGHVFAPIEALVFRVLMIHDYRRLILKDPFLAPQNLPDRWHGEKTREVVSIAYPALKQQTKDWFGQDKIG